jgi:hypothetical protein
MFEGLFQFAFLIVELLVALTGEIIGILLLLPWRFLLCLTIGLLIGFLISHYLQKNALTTAAFWVPATLGLTLGTIWSLRNPKSRN